MIARRAVAVLAVIASVVAGCSSARTPAPSPSPGLVLNQAQLRLRLIETFGPLWYCDRDSYPIAVGDEAALAVKRFPDIEADSETFTAVKAHLRLSGPDFSTDQKLAIYREWKQVNAIVLTEDAGAAFRFDYLNQPVGSAQEGRRTAGTIDHTGVIAIEQQAAASAPNCPICLARGTKIATIAGDVAVEDLRVGDPVWSIDPAGHRVQATVIRVGSTPVPDTHQVVDLALDDGRVVRVSPGHPLADGRPVGSLRIGDRVDGARVVGATLEAYDGGATFDLLPSGPTGAYFADGIPLGSTFATR